MEQVKLDQLPQFESPKVRARQDFDYGWDSIGLFLGGRHSDGKVYAVKNIEVEITEHGEIGFTRPTIILPKMQAQILMDDLWNCGIRPTEGSGSAGSFAAQSKHLEDMRALVKHATGAPLL